MRYLTLLLLFASISLAACSAAVSAPTITPIPANLYRIIDVTVVEVEKGIAVPGQTVTIVGDRIEKIGTQTEQVPDQARIINGHGLYLMPGLVDAHVHYFEAPIYGRLMIANGVLLVRDMGMTNRYILKLRDELNRGETLGPEMIVAGAILDGSPPEIPSISISISTPDEGRAAVRKQAAAGVDMIKVYSALDKKVFLAIVDEAKKLGLKTVGHVPESIYIEDAAVAGLQSSEHFFGFDKVIAKLLGEPVKLTYAGSGSEARYLLRLDEVNPQALQDFYQRLRASGITIDPTVVAHKDHPNVNTLEVQNLPRGEYISPNLLSLWKSMWAGTSGFSDLFCQNWSQMVKGMNKAKIPLMIGTDVTVPGIIPGYSVHEEMVIWQEAGIPAADVLRSATIVPARFMGLDKRLGTIAEGKTASMVLVRANPLDDIRNAEKIEGVFLRGRYFSRHGLDQLLEEAKRLAQK
ncbi:MAG: amidohydrolase family protein [Chloroflexi bacterium]|nr:amidohydrolase family protein [Chloroflexota bacterium]